MKNIERYHRYLRSGAWEVRRWARLVQDDFLCQVCGLEATEVHHLTYEHIYQEPPEDLLSLCGECHDGVTECAKTCGLSAAVDVWRKQRAERLERDAEGGTLDDRWRNIVGAAFATEPGLATELARAELEGLAWGPGDGQLTRWLILGVPEHFDGLDDDIARYEALLGPILKTPVKVELRPSAERRKLEETAPQVVPPPAAPIDGEWVIDRWRDVLRACYRKDPRAQALLNSCRPLAGDDGLTLQFSSPGLLEKAKKGHNVACFREAVQEATGWAVGISFELVEARQRGGLGAL